MALEDVGVRAVIENLGGFLSGMDRIGNKTAALGKKMSSLGKTMTLRVTAPLAAIGGIALKMASDFDKSLREVNTLLNLSGDQFDELKADVIALSNEVGVATSEVIPALYQAISAGVPRDNALEFLRIAAEAAIGGVTDTQTAVDGLTTVLNAFRLDASETQLVADQMFTAVKLGKTTFEELSASMSIVAPIAAALGVGFDEVAASTATLTKSGAPTSIAMTQIRSALVALTKPTAEMEKLLKKAGFASGGAALEALGFAGTLEVLRDAAEGNNQVLTQAFGRVEAVQAVLGLTGENALTAAADMDEMTNAAGAATRAFEEMEMSASRRFERLLVNIKNVAIGLGETLLPVAERVAAAMSVVAQFVGRLNTAMADLPTPIKLIIGGFVGLVAAAGPVLFIVGTMLGAIGNLIPVATAAVGAIGALSFSVGALLGPVTLVAAAIGVLALLWIRDIGGMRDKTRAIFKSIIDLFNQIKQNVALFTDRIQALGITWGRVWDAIDRVLQTAWVTFLQPIFGAINNAIDILTVALAILAGEWGTAWDKIKDIMIRTVNIVIDQINLVLDGFASMVKGLKAVLDAVPGGNPLGNALQKAIDTLEDGIPRLRTFTKETAALGDMLVHVGLSVVPQFGQAIAAANEEMLLYEGQADSAGAATDRYGNATDNTRVKLRALGGALDDLTVRFFEQAPAVDGVARQYLMSLTNLEQLGIETDVYTGLVRTLTVMTGDYEEALGLVTNLMESEYRKTLQGVIADTFEAALATDTLTQSMVDLGKAPLNRPFQGTTAGASVGSQTSILGIPQLSQGNFNRIIENLGGIATAAAQQFLVDVLTGREPFRLIPGQAPHFANGGTMLTAGQAVVGERGPELVNLPAGATVTPLNRGGDVFNVEINHVDHAEDDIMMDMDTIRMLAQT